MIYVAFFYISYIFSATKRELRVSVHFVKRAWFKCFQCNFRFSFEFRNSRTGNRVQAWILWSSVDGLDRDGVLCNNPNFCCYWNRRIFVCQNLLQQWTFYKFVCFLAIYKFPVIFEFPCFSLNDRKYNLRFSENVWKYCFIVWKYYSIGMPIDRWISWDGNLIDLTSFLWKRCS